MSDHPYHKCSDCGLGHTYDGMTGRAKAYKDDIIKLRQALQQAQTLARRNQDPARALLLIEAVVTDALEWKP